MSQLTDQMSESATWLSASQADSGGWGETPHAQHLSVLNTAEAIVALIQADGEALGTRPVQRGVEFLRTRQASTGVDAGAWLRDDDDSDDHTADVVRTGHVLEALMLARIPTSDPTVTRAVGWLLHARNDTGGWGCARGTPTRLFPTCQTLLGLLAVWARAPAGSQLCTDSDREGLGEVLRSEIDLLLDDQRAPGFFSANEIASHLAAPHTIYAVLVLQRARNLGLAKWSKQEHRALDWLLASQDEARRLVSERFDLSPTNHYDFLYVTDSLLIRGLNDSDRKGDRQSTLYRAALYSVKDRIEPTQGACYGYRPFTWATSRAIAGISAAATTRSTFPDRLAEYNVRTAASGWLTAIIIGILILSALLGFFANFSPALFGFFSLIVFALLLVSGKIQAPMFERLVGLALGTGRRSEATRSENEATDDTVADGGADMTGG